MRLRSLGPALCVAAFLSGVTSTRAGESVGAQYENVTEMQGVVVDVLCELTGSCPANCGNGTRLLGLKDEKGEITPIAKGAPIFANATPSVLPFCGKPLQVDGLLIENPKMRLYYVQRYRANASEAWKDDEAFEVQWKAKHGDTNEWFRDDPIVKEAIGDKGILGIKGLAPKPQ